MVVNIAAVRRNALTLSTQVFLYGEEANPQTAHAIAVQIVHNWLNQTTRFEEPILRAFYATCSSDKHAPAFVEVTI